MLSLNCIGENKRPRWFHRGQLSTRNPQSFESSVNQVDTDFKSRIRHPLTHGKEATFWHMIQEGAVEEDRTPDFRRCERIRWPRPIIEHDDDSRVKVWVNQRRGEQRICLWFEQENYLVILADRGKYILPWTAYLVEQPHRQRKLRKEYEAYCRDKGQKG